MNRDMPPQKRNTIIILASIVVIIVGILIFFISQAIYRSGKTPVMIQYAPFISTVTTDNNQKLKNNSVNYLAPGEYHITVSLAEFDTIEITATIKEDTYNLFGELTPNSPAGEDIMRKYRQDYADLQSLYGQDLISSGDQQRAEWPIINYLPINNALFSLGYNTSGDHLQVIIESMSPYINEAVNRLKSLDYSQKPLASYNISYQKWTNPLIDAFSDNNQSDPIEYLKTGYAAINNEDLNLTIQPGSYYNNDQYYYTTITTGYENRYNLVIYHCVLSKKGSSWNLNGTPYPILTTHTTPDTPIELLNLINQP